MSFLEGVLIGVFSPLLVVVITRCWPPLRWGSFPAMWTASAIGGLLFSVLSGPHSSLDWGLVTGNAAGLIAALALWWWRRRRKRAPKALGEKSRALIAALVRRMRETAVPRPVLRPAPQGAS